MLTFWDRKPEDRPTFSSIVQSLSSYLESTSDYLDLSTVVNKENNTTKPEIEEDPEHSIKRVQSTPNNYYTADPEHSITRVPSNPNDYYMADPEHSVQSSNGYYMADQDSLGLEMN